MGNDTGHVFDAVVYLADEPFARFCSRCGKPDLRKVVRTRCTPLDPDEADGKIRRKVATLGIVLGGKPEIRRG